MHLTSEEREVGKLNFCAAIGSPLVNRAALMKTAAEGIKSKQGLGPQYYGYGTVDEPVRVAVLGTGDEGGVLIGALNPKYMQVVAIADIRPSNVWRAFHGDWSSDNARKNRPGLMSIYGWKPEEAKKDDLDIYGKQDDLVKFAKQQGVAVFGDYRALLAKVKAKELEVEAVVIALPLHLHAPAAVAAMQAGLHVLTEKLMAHSVHECKEMAQVAKETGKLLAVGHQRHYNILYANAVELIRKGVLGELHYIRAQWHRGNLPGKDSWQPAMPEEAKPKDKLAGRLETSLADAEKQLKKLQNPDKEKGEKLDPQAIALQRIRIAQLASQIADAKVDAKVSDYVDRQLKDEGGKVIYDRPAIEELLRWRLWDRTGGGLMAELGSHQLDAASIFIQAAHAAAGRDVSKKIRPLSVSAAASRPLFPVDRDIEDHVFCTFEYPAPDYDPKDPQGARKTIGVAYASINGNGYGGYGEAVFGTQGTLLLETEKDAMLYRVADTNGKTKVVKVERQGKPPRLDLKVEPGGDLESSAAGQLGTLPAERGYAEELEHFAWCIRNKSPENKPRCHPEVALADAVIALVTNMAARKGERREFDPRWFDIDDPETPEGVKPDVSRYK